MCASPFLYQPECPSWQMTLWCAGDDFDGRAKLAVLHMKMRWWMVAEVHVYDDTLEAADSGHILILCSSGRPRSTC